MNGQEIYVTGKKSDGKSGRARGSANVPEGRQSEGLIMDYTAWENVGFGYHGDPQFQSGLFMNYAAIKEDAAGKMERFDVRPPNPRLMAKNFSGGNQQKIVAHGQDVPYQAGISNGLRRNTPLSIRSHRWLMST